MSTDEKGILSAKWKSYMKCIIAGKKIIKINKHVKIRKENIAMKPLVETVGKEFINLVLKEVDP